MGLKAALRIAYSNQKSNDYSDSQGCFDLDIDSIDHFFDQFWHAFQNRQDFLVESICPSWPQVTLSNAFLFRGQSYTITI